MNRTLIVLLIASLGWACKQAAVSPKITLFTANPTFLASGISGKLCYGVENAVKVDLVPKVEELLPSSQRCIDISPKQSTTFTLTAFGESGDKISKTVDVRVGAPAPRLSDILPSATEVARGGKVQICFKVENAKSVKVSAGRLDRRMDCLIDRPRKTTTYKIVAVGADREEDTGTVTVKVR